MKKFLLMFLVFVTAFSLSACRRDEDNGDQNGDDTPTAEELLEDAIGRLSFANMAAYEASAISLPTALIHGVSVSWSSSNPDVVTNTGVVNRPFGGDRVDVTLTATFTLDNVSKTKDYVFTILPIEVTDLREEYPDAPYFDNFAALFAAEPTGRIIVEGYVSSSFAWGFFIFDGENHFGIYYDGVPPQGERYQIGDRVQFYGGFANYYSLFQVTRPNASAFVGRDPELNVPVTASSVLEINQLDSTDPLIHGQHFTVRGTLERRQSGSFTNTYIVDGDYELYVYHLSWRNSLDVLAELEGQFVELNVIYFTDHTRDGIYVVFEGTAADVTIITLTDEDLAQSVASQINLGDISNVIDDLTLPTTGANDATITWSSNNTAVIANDGTVTLPETEPVVVTLTATVTVGEASITRDFEVTVLDGSQLTTGLSVADALLEDDGSVINVEGVVTSYPAFAGNPGFFIQDADGTAIFINTDLDVEIGNKVIVRGTLTTYTSFGNARRQINNAMLINNDEEDNAVFVVIDKSLAEIVSTHPASQNVRYRVENVEFIEMQGNFFTFETGEEMKLIIHSSSYGAHLLGNIQAGDTIEWIEFTVYDTFQGDLRAEAVVFSEITETLLEKIIAKTFNFPSNVTGNLNMPTTLEIFGVNYAEGPTVIELIWVSDDTDTIANDGTVTRPAPGEEAIDVEVTLTVVGTDIEKVFELSVVAMLEQAEVIYETGFEDFAKTSYALATIETNGVEWALSEVLRGTFDNDVKNGDAALRGRAPGFAEILQDFPNVVAISFYYSLTNFFDEGQGLLSVEISGDGGETWLEIMAPTSPPDTLTEVNITIDYAALDGINAGDSVRFRLVFTGQGTAVGNQTRINVDDFVIYGN